ncbi:hypothetical protein HH214_11635 [Mucilaginibacter robiniae]|uniref:IPT/TIG domain-containing protein n=1 Tax=Mucilaginibacter robiniae TaxID=2728022 RepID=A0A7L5E1S9_9SPHI|nr:IPT/TIG domain-containing protein [Mucilaginibacter robiniae]QJD96478.1 hypothetical protein HH214_11635 [Mucilaginibacter robiniae]
MKQTNNLIKYLLSAVLLVIGFSSCKKDSNGQLEGSKGTPTISSVRTISKSVVDSSKTETYTTIASNGTSSSTTVSNYNPQISAFDSTTTTGKLGNYYAAMGDHLGSATKVMINNVSIPFNRALNSDNSVIFNIPSSIPYVQPQPNTLTIVTLYGTVTYSFTTLPPAPSISAASDYNFTSGTKITLKGTGFSAVTAIKLRASNEAVTIVTKADTQLVVTMPKSTATRSTLLFTYTSGSSTVQTASGQEFVNIDLAYSIFTNGQYQNNWTNNSWANPSGATPTAPSISGQGSFVATYPAGGWQIEGFANYSGGFKYDASYKYLTFWVKGGTVDHTLVLVGDQMAGGDAQVQNANAYAAQLIKVPAKVWTYFKIPLTTSQSSTNVNQLNYWAKGNTATTLRFFLMGQSGDVNETYYFDEVMFVK